VHRTRVIVAVVAIPLLYLYVTKLPAIYFLALIVVVNCLALHEFYGMYRVPAAFAACGIGCSGLLFVPHLFALPHPLSLQALFYAPVFMVLASLRLFAVRNAENSLSCLAPIGLGILYIPTLLVPQWMLRLQGIEWIFFLYLSVWASDTCAYYIGRQFGRRKLYPEISPKKTVAGGYGSLLGGTLVGIVMGIVSLPSWGAVKLGGFGLVIGGITIVGDLVESMFKRDAGVKDSGSLIPGHGGILDRIDSILFAGPALYLLQRVFA